MKFFQSLSCAALLFAALLFTACEKDKDLANSVTPVVPVNKEPCRLVKAIYDSYYSKHIYDNNGKLIKINFYNNTDSISYRGYRFSYNSAGKAAEEIEIDSDNTIIRKRVFTYNSQNLLIRMDVYKNYTPGGINQLAEYCLYQYNSAGKRVLTQHYLGSQPGKMDYFSEYVYSQNKILEKYYDALKMPVVLTDTVKFYFDNQKSVYSALECWNTFVPEMEKHNIILVESRGDASWSDYEYNNWGYPIKERSGAGMFISSAIYEYDCN